MQRVTLFSLAASILIPALAVQVPLGPNYRRQNTNQAHLTSQDGVAWSLHGLPNPNDTDHLVFETVHSLLQHWPNTRMRNGHSIVPGTIPKGTLLYRGGPDKELPVGPEWVATDPEHAYIFCHDGFEVEYPQPGCWQLTLSTTRPLKVLYFDGSSAAKIPYGSMDTGDLLAWGEITPPDDIMDEFERIEDLCKWGSNFNVDGFVRMEMDFEIILCDLASGVSVVSWMNLASWQITPPVSPTFIAFEVMNAGSWHNHFPGETRIQLDLPGLVSFYDTQLVPSLIPVRVGQERWDHRAGNASGEDLAAVKSRLEAALARPSGLSSGIEWKTLFQVIVDRFAGRLELTRHLLNSSADANNILDLAQKTQSQLRIMLAPYIFLSAKPRDPSDKTDLDWAIPICKHCATTHTKLLKSEIDSMTNSEKLLLRSVEGTTREICRVVTKMWAAGVYAGTDQLLNKKNSTDIAELTQVWSKWAEDLNWLMTWLDWSVWVKCNPGCSPEEMCYLPTWPVGFPGFTLNTTSADRPVRSKGWTNFDKRAMVTEKVSRVMSNVIQPKAEDWVRPEPRCIRRVDPYDLEPVYDGKIPTKDLYMES